MVCSKNSPAFLARSILAALALFALAGCQTFSDAPDSETFVFLDTDETLYVRFTMSMDLMLESSYPSIAEHVKEKRFEDYFATMRRLLQVYRFPMEVYLLEEFEEAGAGPVLELNAVRWEKEDYGDIRVVLKARLERFGDVNTLGLFRAQDSPSLMANQERTDEVYARVMETALSQMFVELMEHFETTDEIEFVNELAPE